MPKLKTHSGAPQVCHIGDPGDLDLIFPAQLRQGLSERGVGVFRQIYPGGFSGTDSFLQLLGADGQGIPGNVGQIAAFRYFTFLLPIHTRLYYTHFPKKVNKIIP